MVTGGEQKGCEVCGHSPESAGGTWREAMKTGLVSCPAGKVLVFHQSKNSGLTLQSNWERDTLVTIVIPVVMAE